MTMKTIALAVALLSQAYMASAQTCGSDTGGNTYNVGGGSNPYNNIGDVPLLNLQPGDWVCIYPGTYNEKWLINVEGTASQPIVFSGVPDGSGNLPVIDGNGAVTSQALNYWNEVRNVIKVGGGSPTSTNPQYIRIQNLKITGGYPGNSFTTDRGGSARYSNNAACIMVEKGANIDIIGNEITGCGNGIFSGTATYDLLIEDNYIHGNGVSGRFYEHNTYISSIRVTYRFNRMGPLCPTCLGNNLKDRSAGLVVAYNYIEGGNRQLDLVDNASLSSLPEYGNTYVYGNILVEMDGEGNRQMVHFGDDQNAGAERPRLYFYHNTVLSKRTDRNTLFLLRKAGSTIEAYNNIIIATDSSAGIELLADGGPGTLNMYNNLIAEGYDDCYFCSNPNVAHSGTMTDGAYWPFFADSNYQNTNDVHLSKSLLLGADLTSVPVPGIAEEYVYHTSSTARSAMDLGAFGFGAPFAAPTGAPFAAPTGAPFAAPTGAPFAAPTGAPFAAPTGAPFAAPTGAPFAAPTGAPFAAPTGAPFAAPTGAPFAAPTGAPNATPVAAPTSAPFAAPTGAPFAAPTGTPFAAPTGSFVETMTVSDVSSSEWTTVPLPKTYTSPIIMCSPINANPSMPEVVMVESVTSNSFDIKLLEVGPNVDVQCLVVEQEAWVLGSETLHVMTFNV